jgi:hypothetical protein
LQLSKAAVYKSVSAFLIPIRDWKRIYGKHKTSSMRLLRRVVGSIFIMHNTCAFMFENILDISNGIRP